MAVLDKKGREALPSEMFAFPRTRQCPIHDESHVKWAWANIDTAKGVTPEERGEARRLTLARAGALGVNTREWNRVKSLRLECMSLDISTSDHPNKMPFSGVLTKLDEPSDAAPGGAGGKRIIVTSAAARAALGSLLGMAVDFTSSFDGHDPQAKIGIITSADVVGNEVRIEGFVYAADFPDTVDLIQKLKDVLGFSFEAQRLLVEDMSADILTITELTFTGAAILLKDKAAYQTTSLAALAAAIEEMNMTAEELQAILAEAMKPITARLDKMEQDNKAIVEHVEANATTRAMVEPHCAALDACHAAMAAAGVGTDAKHGHVAVLQRMSDSMRAEAALGKVPHIFRDHDSYYASADGGNNEEIDMKPDELKTLIAEAVKSAVDVAVKPLQDELKNTTDKLAAAETKLKDAEALRIEAAAAPVRKTLPPAVTALMSRADISLPDGDGKLNTGAIDKALSGANLTISQRIMVKNQLERIGVLAA